MKASDIKWAVCAVIMLGITMKVGPTAGITGSSLILMYLSIPTIATWMALMERKSK